MKKLSYAIFMLFISQYCLSMDPATVAWLNYDAANYYSLNPTKGVPLRINDCPTQFMQPSFQGIMPPRDNPENRQSTLTETEIPVQIIMPPRDNPEITPSALTEYNLRNRRNNRALCITIPLIVAGLVTGFYFITKQIYSA